MLRRLELTIRQGVDIEYQSPVDPRRSTAKHALVSIASRAGRHTALEIVDVFTFKHLRKAPNVVN